MQLQRSIPTPTTPEEAFALQRDLASDVVQTPLNGPVMTVAAADVAYSLDEQRAYAGVVVLELPSLRIVEQATWQGEPPTPYISGLFAWREAPCLVEAFAALKTTPDVVMIDSQGRAHPRRFGLACHLGLMLDVPTLGCAKTQMMGGKWSQELASERGAIFGLEEEGERLGVALRTQEAINPVFVSVGHRIDLQGAIDVTLQTSPRFRIPEPLRQAHLLSIALRKEGEG